VKLRLNYYKTGPKDDQKQQHSRSPQSTGYVSSVGVGQIKEHRVQTNPIDERAEETLTADGEEHEGRRGSEIVGTSAVNDFNESYSELNVEPPTPTLGGVNIAANPTIRMVCACIALPRLFCQNTRAARIDHVAYPSYGCE
jgi:hypothetical protein